MSVSPDKQVLSYLTGKNKANNHINDSPNKIHTTGDLKAFMSFLCDRQCVEMTIVIRSSIEIFKYCVPSRAAVLAFHRELLDEYSTYYWMQNRSNDGKIGYTGELTRRFYEMAQLKLADAREDQQSEFGSLEQPSKEPKPSPVKSASTIASPASPTCSQSCSSPTPGPKIIPTTPKVIPVSRRTSSSNSNNMEQTPMSPSALDTDSNLTHISDRCELDVNIVDIFHELENLISLIRSTLFDLLRGIQFSNSNLRNTLIDWASEFLIALNVKQEPNPSNLISKEIELRLKNPVNKLLVDLILESHNDIPSFFMKLLNSTQSWDWLLAHILSEISKKPSRKEDFSSCMEYIINRQTAAKSTTNIIAYLSDTNPKAIATIPALKLNLNLISQLLIALNVKQEPNPSNLISKEIELRLKNPVNKLLVGLLLESHNDIPAIFKKLVNCTQSWDWLLAHILSEMSKKSNREEDFSSCMKYIINRQTAAKSVTNIVAYLSDTNPKAIANIPALKLNMDLISKLLVDKLSAVSLDLESVAQLIKLCLNSLEQVSPDKICISTKYRLCMSLATCFYLLLETETDNFPEILSYIRMSLTCMSLLKQSSVASHILCRALLERSLAYKHLFNDAEIGPLDWTSDESINLSKENLKVTLGHRFRRLPNIKQHHQNRNTNNKENTKPDKHSINCYLLIEAFKSSINDIEAFAALFVEYHCPVMFDKHSWPKDDALRTINERNLSILRKFEQIPPLWDLYELIGQAGCLKSCLVLVKALFAAHLALWASATTNLSQDKMLSTSRLIPPLAQSNLVPQAFGLTVEVFPHLAANEVFSVLSDIWQYLKDSNTNDHSDMGSAKAYLNRLRLFMCEHIPGPLYVKIFKDLQDKPVANQ